LRGVPSERVHDESVAMCVEIITELRAIPDLAGVHVMAFGSEELVPEIIERAGIGRRAHARTNERVG
jgi:methylenetetrahydrofolate reductase (NADPH)